MAILYYDDILNSNVHIHTETTNVSFIRMAQVLKRMGIRNNKFFLALYQKDLIGVDPFDPNLDAETITKILAECKINFWYWLRECVRVPSSGGPGIPFILNRANLAAAFSYLNDIDYGQVQPRQTGKSIGTQCQVAYHMFIASEALDIGMFTKDANLVHDNVSRLKEIRDGLPPYMVTHTSADQDRKEGMSYAARKTYYKTFASANDEKAADKQGRKP